MSRVPAILDLQEEDLQLLLAAHCHLGVKNVTSGMTPYVYKRRADGVQLIHLGKTWEKLVFTARVIAAIENPKDIAVIAACPFGHRAALKFAKYIGAEAIVSRFTPGTFTIYITRSFREPRLVICTDPHSDSQAIKEASYVNIPVISLADTDDLLHFIDVAIPTNNKGKHAIGLIYWLLARTVLRLRGSLEYSTHWDVMMDMFFYREPEEAEKDQQEAGTFDTGGARWGAVADTADVQPDWAVEDSALDGPGAYAPQLDWSGAITADWADDHIPATVAASSLDAPSDWDAGITTDWAEETTAKINHASGWD